MKLALILHLLIFWQGSLASGVLKKNPYLQTSNKPKTHLLKLRVIEHGNSMEDIDFHEQVKATEIIYSQCPGVELKVEVVDVLKRGKSRLHEDMDIVDQGIPYSLTQDYYDFFMPFARSHQENVIDVHLVDFVDKHSRVLYERDPFSSGNFAVALTDIIVPFLYRDLKYLDQSLSPAQISRNSIFMATKIYQYQTSSERILIKNPNGLKKTGRKTLLAHELGHIVMESQRPGPDDLYINHYCPGIDDFCLDDNLMVTGGYDDYTLYHHSKKNKIKGFAPLPNIEKEQCETLLKDKHVIHL